LGNWTRTTSTARLRVSREELARAIGPQSQWEFAEQVGLKSAGLIGHLLSGRRTSCAPGTAEKIEEALGVAPGAFFDLVVPPVERRSDPPRETRGAKDAAA
jgi:hypothetical protein